MDMIFHGAAGIAACKCAGYADHGGGRVGELISGHIPTDLENAWQTIKATGDTAAWRRALDRAAELCAEHWPFIERLADAIMEYGELDGAEVDRIYRAYADALLHRAFGRWAVHGTFTRPGFAPSTVPVQLEAAQPGVLEAKFAPDPVFAALRPLHAEKERVTRPARTATSHAAPPREVHESQSWWCRLFGCS
jgi:hypothetical protein